MRIREFMAKVRRSMQLGATALVGTQVAVMIGLTVNDVVRRQNRKLSAFPVTPPAPIRVEDDLVTVYTFGRDLYADMLASIDAARERICFETFIWKDDEVGHQFKDALEAAADRGVEVYVVHDVFANLVVDQSFFTFPDNIHVRRHPLVASLWPSIRNSGRDHRKLLIVDGHDSYIGGYNIGDTYADRWRDTHARIQGPAAGELENAFVDYWNMRPMGVLVRSHDLPELEPPHRQGWESAITVHRNMPRWRMYPIRAMYLEAIDRATRHIYLTQAYLIPDDDLIQALFQAAKRGVDVRIIVPAQSNHVVADWLSRGFYEEMLTKGVRLFLYQGAMVHSKTATIDGAWSTIGTANLDMLSLAGNYEVNAEFTSPELAAKMEEVFATDLRNCLELDLEKWRSRSPVAKFTEILLAPWRPLF